MGNLSLVQRDDHAVDADAATSDEAAAHEEAVVLAAGLQRRTEAEEDGGHEDGAATANGVGKPTGKESTAKGADGEQRRDQALCVAVGVEAIDALQCRENLCDNTAGCVSKIRTERKAITGTAYSRPVTGRHGTYRS